MKFFQLLTFLTLFYFNSLSQKGRFSLPNNDRRYPLTTLSRTVSLDLIKAKILAEDEYLHAYQDFIGEADLNTYDIEVIRKSQQKCAKTAKYQAFVAYVFDKLY